MKIPFLVITTFFFTKLYSQTIQWKLIDKNNNKPLQFATIIIKKDMTVYKTGVSDSLGNFSFKDLGTGKYNIEFSFINYQKATMSVLITYDTVIENVALVPLPSQLKEVTLVVRKPLIERKSDRLIFNVSNNVNVNVIGLDALELLAKAPQIRVDGNAISMTGKGTVGVMINDRLQQMSTEARAGYLKALPAEAVESIEIISNPPAMYSAEGSSGLINIVLKKKREPGYRGTANVNLTSPPSPKVAPGISMNYNKKNVRYYGSLNVSKGYQNPFFTANIRYPTLTQEGSTKVKEESQYVSVQTGFDADLTKSSSLGVSFGIFYSYPYQTNTIRTLFINNKTKNVDSISEESIKNKIFYHSKSSNIHYVKYFDTVGKRRIVLDADWYSNGFDFPNKIKSVMYGPNGILVPDRTSQTISNNTLASTIYSLNGVVYLPAKKYELYFGGKVNFIKSSNYVSLDITKTEQNLQEISTSNFFSFTENTQALFVNYIKDFGKKWSFQSGLRAENTQTSGRGLYAANQRVNKGSYFELFPTVYLSHKLNEKNTLSFNYARRINRPGFNNFNPYPQYSSRYMYSEGNPYLLPSISNNFQLSESFYIFLPCGPTVPVMETHHWESSNCKSFYRT